MKNIVYMFNICVAILLMSCNPINNPSANKYVFSVSADKQVQFSPGNLQYVISKDKWQFANNQWEYLGTSNLNNPTYDNYNEGWVSNPLSMGDVIDMFPWGKADNPTIKSANIGECGYIEYINYIDYGTNVIDKYPANTWRTLRADEWNYIVSIRTNANRLKGVASVDGVDGLILLPDDWVCPTGITFKSGHHTGNYWGGYSDYQKISQDQWTKMEASGAIFLPASGYRDGTAMHDVRVMGVYWTPNYYLDDNVVSFGFASGEISLFYGYERHQGLSVRLVRDL